MHALTYRITTVSPVVIEGRDGDPNMVPTMKYVPGTSMLGLFAQWFLEHRPPSAKPVYCDPQFQQWFLAGALKFGPAYLVEDRSYFPTPFSIQREKQSDEVHDFLHTDEEFQVQTKNFDPFCYLNNDMIAGRDVATRLHFHHARDRRKGIPLESALFTYEAIEPEQCFEGMIIGEEGILQALADKYPPTWKGYLGRSKNAQYGMVKVALMPPKPIKLPDTTVWENEISLTLLSDTIIYNDEGFATTDWRCLSRYLGKSVEIRRAFIKAGRVEHFVSVWRLKTPAEVCLAAGSTFLLDISACDRGQLAVLAREGIGERTHEGFGRCVFDRQRHDQLHELKNVVKTWPRPLPMKDKEVPLPPPMTRTILMTILREYFVQQSGVLAINEQREFVGLPPASLLGKLETMARGKSHQEFVDALNVLVHTVSFQVNNKSIERLEHDGWSARMIAALNPVLNQEFSTENAFIAAVTVHMTDSLSQEDQITLCNAARKFNQPKPVQRHLENCRNKNGTLLDFLRDHPATVASLITQTPHSQALKLCQAIGYQPETDRVLAKMFEGASLAAFFSAMRKRAKAQEGTV